MSRTHKDVVGKHGNLSYNFFSKTLKRSRTNLNNDSRLRIFWGYKEKPLRHHKEDVHLLENMEDYSESPRCRAVVGYFEK